MLLAISALGAACQAVDCLGAGIDVEQFENVIPSDIIVAMNALAASSNASAIDAFAAILALGCPYPNSILVDGTCECVAERECLVGYNEALGNYVCVDWAVVIVTLVVGTGGLVYAVWKTITVKS